MSSLKAKIAGVASLAVAVGAAALLTAGAASAAVTVPAPAITNDPNASNGTVAFYDANGNVITSGSNLKHLFDYAQASTPPSRTGVTKATVFFAFPDHTQADSQNWFSTQVTTSTTFPNATWPAPLNTTTNPTAFAAADEADLGDLLSTTTQDTTAGYQGILQIRIYDSGPGVGVTSNFWASDIYYDATAGTWQQVWPTVKTATQTTLTANPDPSTVGDTVTLKATVTPSGTAGSVQFQDGSTNIGSPVAVSNGTATTTTSSLSQGTHNLSAVFTPTDTSSFSGSTGTTTATVNPAATRTTTTLSLSGNYTTAGQDATLTASVSPSSAPGSVAFYDNGTSIAGTVNSPTAGTYTLDVSSGFTAGGHSIVAKFTPADVTQFAVSQSQPQAFLTQAQLQGACAQPGSNCTSTSNIQASIPVGTLVISTPYTSANPLDLGTLKLNSDATLFSGTAKFSDITVTDLRSGTVGWDVSALASDLTNGGSKAGDVINAQNVGLTNVKSTPGTGFAGTVTPTDNAAANGVAPGAAGSAGLGGTTPHQVAHATNSRGTVTMDGDLTLIAPSSTDPGLFTGTITFTVG